METTRSSLLLRIRDLQDRRSWEEFVEIYGPFLLRVLRRHGISREDAMDVVQETFQTVATHIGEFQYDPGKSFRRYLSTIAVRRAWNLLRSKQHRPAAAGGTGHVQVLQQVRGEVVDEEWYRRRLEMAVELARRRLSDREAEVFTLSDLQGLADQEVAGRLGIDIGNVYVCKSRARKKVKQALEEIDD